MSKVVSVNISQNTGEKKQSTESACAVVDKGLETDAHAKGGQRQISLLAVESIQKMIEEGVDVGPGDFAENITTEGLNLLDLPVGTRFKIGEALLEITRHGKECPAPCAIYHQVGHCVMPTEGIFAKVIEGGMIKPDDPIAVLKS